MVSATCDEAVAELLGPFKINLHCDGSYLCSRSMAARSLQLLPVINL